MTIKGRKCESDRERKEDSRGRMKQIEELQIERGKKKAAKMMKRSKKISDEDKNRKAGKK